jgi:hypothetical protein
MEELLLHLSNVTTSAFIVTCVYQDGSQPDLCNHESDRALRACGNKIQFRSRRISSMRTSRYFKE